MKLTLMYFSPTHTTKKVVGAVGKVLFEKFLCHTEVVDLTPALAREREYVFGEDDIVVFGAPVYGGRVPPLLAPVLSKLQGNGARAVVLSVYGNRDYDDALLETADIFTERGFLVCAAGAFIGEHSYSDKVGGGRPDRDDIVAAQSFGIIAAVKVKAGKPIAKPLRGNRPYKELGASMTAPKPAPALDAERCTHCGGCVSVCPVNNIAADLTDRGACIACAACVKFCPQRAREFADEHIAAVREKLEKNCTARRSPEFFV